MVVQMQLKISNDSTEEHMELCEKLAALFVERNMSEVDRIFYDDMKSGRLKLKWRM
jgi:DNA-binding XRE family transcriptional regulator